jgi:hypothetical protein
MRKPSYRTIPRRVAHPAPAVVSAIAILVATVVVGAAAGHPPLPPGGVLYDQYDNPSSNATNSQDYGLSDPFHDEAADDFVVPVGQTWIIDSVDVQGVYYNGSGPALSVNVRFYDDAPGNLPPNTNTPRCARWNQSYNGGASFVINLTSPCSMGAGTHWVSVQANMEFAPGGQWGWIDRTVMSSAGAAWRNPGNGFGTDCVYWGRRSTTCDIDPAAPDQVYRLRGICLGVYSGVPCQGHGRKRA